MQSGGSWIGVKQRVSGLPKSRYRDCVELERKKKTFNSRDIMDFVVLTLSLLVISLPRLWLSHTHTRQTQWKKPNAVHRRLL